MSRKNKIYIGLSVLSVGLFCYFAYPRETKYTPRVSIEAESPLWKDMLARQRAAKERAYVPNDRLVFSRTVKPESATSVTSQADMAEHESELLGTMSAPLRAVGDARLSECAREFRDRHGPITERYTWNITLHWVGEGEILQVVNASSSEWPKVFDAEAVACWADVMEDLQVVSELKLDRLVEFEFCIYPAQEKELSP
jgi:hypothetical protein